MSRELDTHAYVAAVATYTYTDLWLDADANVGLDAADVAAATNWPNATVGLNGQTMNTCEIQHTVRHQYVMCII